MILSKEELEIIQYALLFVDDYRKSGVLDDDEENLLLKIQAELEKKKS